MTGNWILPNYLLGVIALKSLILYLLNPSCNVHSIVVDITMDKIGSTPSGMDPSIYELCYKVWVSGGSGVREVMASKLGFVD